MGPPERGRPSHGGATRPARRRAGRVAVFAPSPIVTITVEAGEHGPAIHLHAGGQGIWVARLAAALGARVTLCCSLGGESGRVLRGLIAGESVALRAAEADLPNGAYIHDRRGGERVEVASVASGRLGRHAADELYGIALGAGLDADVTLITGCQPPDVVDADLYRRLAGDLRGNGRTAIADVTGPPLRATLAGGVELLKLSNEELVREGYAASAATGDLLEGAHRLCAEGARHVLVSRAPDPTLLVGPGSALALTGPAFEAVDHRGAGDSMLAAIGVALARGRDMLAAVRLGIAGGALNATRRGLGSGTRREIERLAAHVAVAPLRAPGGG